MMRPSVVAISMSMLAACGGLAYCHVTRQQAVQYAADSNESTRTIAPVVETATGATSAQPSVFSATEEASQATPSSVDASSPAEIKAPRATNAASEAIAQWIKDTQSADANTRATAIAALADAPKTLAMPALERVLETGEANVDRHIALRSMHSIALRDGDATGQIRDTMRHAIYHGDDDGVTQTAQSLLDDIEAEFALREQNAR